MIPGSADWRFADEVDWVIPAVILTFGLIAFTLFEIPDYAGILPALELLPLWLLASLALSGALATPAILKMLRADIEHPLTHCLKFLRENWKFLLFVEFGVALAGLNMIAFMWVKPLLNYLVPFWADPYLASIDHGIFGMDPWRLLRFLSVTPLAIFYHRAWFALMIVTLLTVLLQPSTKRKSAVLLTYFLLWSVFGPFGHAMLPAAGPVFYAKLGYGDRFAGLVMEHETRDLADYLWSSYVTRGFGGGSGISAMPSLHIATTAWMVIAVRQFARAWTIPAIVVAVLIYLLSIGLGWHYAVDGLVGAVAAYVIWMACVWTLETRSKPALVAPEPT